MCRDTGWKKGFIKNLGRINGSLQPALLSTIPLSKQWLLCGKKVSFWREENRKMTSTDLPHSIYFPAGTYFYLTCTFIWFQLTRLNFFRHSVSQHYLNVSCRKEDFWQGSTGLINFPLSDQSVYRVPINVVALWLVFALHVAPVPRMLPACCTSLMLCRSRTQSQNAAFSICSWVTFLYLLKWCSKGGNLETRTQTTCTHQNWKPGEWAVFWAVSWSSG